MPWDMDDVFAYETVRLVKVKDYRLGLPHALITLIIVVKIFFIDLIVGGGYLQRETSVTGTVRLTLQAPGETYADGSSSQVRRILAHKLPYCLKTCVGERQCSGDVSSQIVQCPAIYSNAAFVKFPSLEGQGAVFLTSRVDMVEESLPRSCVDSSMSSSIQSTETDCYQWQPTSNQSWYISQLEDFLVKIDHSMMAPNLALAQPGYNMESGSFLADSVEDIDATDPAEIDPCDDWHDPTPCPTHGSWGLAVGANGANDVVKVSTLLRAAGILTLDIDRRQKGVVLLLRIHYDNCAYEYA